MRLASLRGLALALLLAAAVVSLIVLARAGHGLGAAEPPNGKPKSGAAGKAPAPPAFPPGTIIALYDKLDDILEKMPNAIVLDPEKYREMQDEIIRLRKLIERPWPNTPG